MDLPDTSTALPMLAVTESTLQTTVLAATGLPDVGTGKALPVPESDCCPMCGGRSGVQQSSLTGNFTKQQYKSYQKRIEDLTKLSACLQIHTDSINSYLSIYHTGMLNYASYAE